MTTPGLYQLTNEYRQLMQTLSDLDIDAQTASDTIESTGLEDDIADRVQARMFVARAMRSHAETVDAEIKRLSILKKHYADRADAVEESTLAMLQSADLQTVECPLMVVKVRNNPISVEITDPGLIPAQYLRAPAAPPPAPDKAAIKEAMTHGIAVPGVQLVQKQRLTIT